MTARRKIVLWSLFVLALAGGALSWLSVTFSMSMCCGPQAATAAQARNKGLLAAAPRVACPTVEWKGVEYRIAEAWVERSVRMERRWLVWMRTVPSGRYSLYLRFDERNGRTPMLPMGTGRQPVFVHGDSLHAFGWTGGFATTSMRPPFPDSICPRLVPFDTWREMRMRDPVYRARVDSILRANRTRASTRPR